MSPPEDQARWWHLDRAETSENNSILNSRSRLKSSASRGKPFVFPRTEYIRSLSYTHGSSPPFMLVDMFVDMLHRLSWLCLPFFFADDIFTTCSSCSIVHYMSFVYPVCDLKQMHISKAAAPWGAISPRNMPICQLTARRAVARG